MFIFLNLWCRARGSRRSERRVGCGGSSRHPSRRPRSWPEAPDASRSAGSRPRDAADRGAAVQDPLGAPHARVLPVLDDLRARLRLSACCSDAFRDPTAGARRSGAPSCSPRLGGPGGRSSWWAPMRTVGHMVPTGWAMEASTRCHLRRRGERSLRMRRRFSCSRLRPSPSRCAGSSRRLAGQLHSGARSMPRPSQSG
jgi:hypothetical protein